VRVISERQLTVVFGALPGTRRVVLGGNYHDLGHDTPGQGNRS
jgi:hypothetical protein